LVIRKKDTRIERATGARGRFYFLFHEGTPSKTLASWENVGPLGNFSMFLQMRFGPFERFPRIFNKMQFRRQIYLQNCRQNCRLRKKRSANLAKQGNLAILAGASNGEKHRAKLEVLRCDERAHGCQLLAFGQNWNAGRNIAFAGESAK
jgi:hypothetical protein